MGKRKAEDKAPAKDKMDVDGDDSGSEDVSTHFNMLEVFANMKSRIQTCST